MELKKNICLIIAIAIIFKPSLGITQSKSDKQSPIVVGKTTKLVEPDIKYEWGPKEQVHLGTIITKNDKQYLKLVAFGGRFAAGYQNGGLYRKGQQVAYPNLVAIQMGIKNFSSPIFALDQGNGTGYKVLKEAKPYPELLEVTNNLGYSDYNKTQLNAYNENVSNYAIPNVSFSLLAKSFNEMTSTNDPRRSNF